MGRSNDRSPDPATSASTSGNGGEPAGRRARSATAGRSQETHELPAAVRTDGGDRTDAEAVDGTATEQADGENSEAHDGATAEQAAVPAGSAQTGKPARVSTPDRFDWRGWLVVVVVFVSFLVIPAVVLYLPDAHWFLTAIGLSRRQAYVVFPMVPAIVLGVTAVWAAVRAHSRAR